MSHLKQPISIKRLAAFFNKTYGIRKKIVSEDNDTSTSFFKIYLCCKNILLSRINFADNVNLKTEQS